MTVNPSAEVLSPRSVGGASTAIPRNLIRRFRCGSSRSKPFPVPDSRPLYEMIDKPWRTGASFRSAAIPKRGAAPRVSLRGARWQPAQSIDARLRGSYTLRTAAAALALVLAGTLLIAGVLLPR